MIKKNRMNVKMSMRSMMGKKNNMNIMKLNRNQSLNQNKVKDMVLSQGMKSSLVERLQMILNDLINVYPGLEILVIDGIFGEKTQKNVKIFQEENGLTTNGIVDVATWDKIHEVHSQKSAITNKDKEYIYMDNSKNVLGEGSKGKYVMELQKYLNQISTKYTDIPKINVDGIFGDKTKESVLAFQKKFKIDDDLEKGIVGDITWNMLYNVINGKVYLKNDY
ncbi:MAG: peptidoglycan-binding protein [Clostridia bacterium]